MEQALLLFLFYVAVLRKEAERCGHELKFFHFLTLPFNYYIKAKALDGQGPFLNARLYPEFNELKDDWYSVWEEYDAARDLMKRIQGERFFKSDITDDGKWKRIKLKFYGEWKHEDRFPKTIAILKKIPGLKAAMFSVLEPGAVIKPHIGINSGCARVHLGLEAPIGAEIDVKGEQYEWRAGELVFFDDTYVHSVRNRGDSDRVVLFMDVERKTEALAARTFLNGIARVLARE